MLPFYYLLLFTPLAAASANEKIQSDEPILKVDQSAAAAAGYLFADNTDSRLNLSDPVDAHLSIILDRTGPDLRPSRGTRDFPDITIEVARRAWSLLHQHALLASRKRALLAYPAIEEVLISASVSEECRKGVSNVFEGIQRLDSWAIRLLSSWGSFPPAGLFEGTSTDVGAYYTCLDNPENKMIGHTHYCSISLRPILPPRKDYELIVRPEPTEMLSLFARNLTNQANTSRIDVFDDILAHAHYQHYVYYKVGTCWPIGCSPFDIKRVVKLIGRRNILSTGPIRCYSNFEHDYEQPGSVEPANSTTGEEPPKMKLKITNWDIHDGLFIWKPHFNQTQKMALAVIIFVFLIVFLCTLLDVILFRLSPMCRRASELMKGYKLEARNQNLAVCCTGGGLGKSDVCNNEKPSIEQDNIGLTSKDDINQVTERCVSLSISEKKNDQKSSLLMELVSEFSMVTNTVKFFTVSDLQMKQNIHCLSGIRCITMAWVLINHTMVCNDWSAFARTRQIEPAAKSLATQLIFNGSYLVDSFFIMSGLLSSYTALRLCKGTYAKFSAFGYLLNRWLRLSFHIFFVSMIFIVLPAVSSGPHWAQLVSDFAEHCQENWWVNVLHLQAFYKQDRMCNMVTWWISIDSLYHVVGLFAILAILSLGYKFGGLSIVAFVVANLVWMFKEHFTHSYPPNVLATIPSIGAFYSDFTLGYFWTVYAHTVPYFLGLFVGYLLAVKQKMIYKWFNTRRALIGWFISITLFFAQGFSTYWWVNGLADYPPWLAAVFNVTIPIVWAGCVNWYILACHHGYGGFINSFLSAKPFIVLGRATYSVYLSHFQIIFLFLGRQNVLMEPTPLFIIYMILGNVIISTLYGIFLAIAIELPWLNVQKRIAVKILVPRDQFCNVS